MRRFVFIVLALVLSFSLFGCGKKEAPLEEAQVPVTMETLSTTDPIKAAVSGPMAQTAAPQEAIRPELMPVPAKPTGLEIQTALLNAGFDPGKLDGKIGPKTKKAVEAFQKKNNLKVDGRVGPQTWAVLSPYLTGSKPKKR
jgi:peptidoglycan hydrolase-like protein with peptidoglycan-binding domain